MNWKKIIIGCSIALVVFIVLAAIGGFYAYRHFITPLLLVAKREVPVELKNPGIRVGTEFLSKKLFLQDSQLEQVTDIVLGELDPSPGDEIGIASSSGALFVTRSATIKSSVMFNTRGDHVDIIDVEKDGICEFMNRGMWIINASLIDHKGKEVWNYSGASGVDDMSAGDVNGDGTLEFVVGFNGGGGVHLIDKAGKKKWSQPDGNVWHVEVVDINGDGKSEIVHSNAGGEIKVRDSQGNIIKQSQPSAYFSHFSLCKWPNKSSREYILYARDSVIWILNYDGKPIFQFNAPECGDYGDARGALVKLFKDQPEYLAVAVTCSNWNRTIFYLYDPTGKLVYKEVLDETGEAIAAIPLDNSGTDNILLGGNGRVWQYKIGKK